MRFMRSVGTLVAVVVAVTLFPIDMAAASSTQPVESADGLRGPGKDAARVRVTGQVMSTDGDPVSGAVIVTAHGGTGVSGMDGAFAFDVEMPTTESSLGVTAVASEHGRSLTGSILTRIRTSESGRRRTADAGVITMSAGTEGPSCGELAWLPTFGSEPGM